MHGHRIRLILPVFLLMVLASAGINAEPLGFELITFTTADNNSVDKTRIFDLNAKLRIRLQISGLKKTAEDRYHIQADVKILSGEKTVIDGKNIINRSYPTEDLDTLITFFNILLSDTKFNSGREYRLNITVRDLKGKQSKVFTAGFKIK